MDNMMSIIFSNVYDDEMGELTQHRTLGSLPFGGRYRLVDFALSNIVNSGINNVGIITKQNYQSLMDHVGSGKEWDLDRKKDGLFILPPYSTGSTGVYRGKLEALGQVTKYLHRSTNKYVVLVDTNIICNIDYEEVLKYHIDKKADITVVTKKLNLKKTNGANLVLKPDDTGRVYDVLIDYHMNHIMDVGLGMYIIDREYLIRLVEDAWAHNRIDFEKDIIQSKFGDTKIYAYEFDGFVSRINSVRSYFEANMKLLDKDTRNEVFSLERPIFTKVRDEIPVLYGDGNSVKNCLIADGCKIEGTVENSILFRGVKIEKGAVVKNSIIMQDTSIGENAVINYCIADKEVKIGKGRMLVGADSYPAVINKGSIL